jgi:hypothetical protein
LQISLNNSLITKLQYSCDLSVADPDAAKKAVKEYKAYDTLQKNKAVSYKKIHE